MADVAELELRVSSKRAVDQTKKVDRQLKQLGTTATATGNVMTRNFQKAGAAASGLKGLLVAITGALAFRAGIRTIAQFGQEMAGVKALTRATADEMDKLSATARQLGASTKFTAAEVASGMQFMAMAGFEVNEVVQAMPGTLDLAAAGMIDLASAADIATNILSGFGMQAGEMARVGDVMAETAASANTNVFELGEAMKFAAPLAKNLEIEIEELSAGVGILSNAGIKGGEAGTTLRRVMLSLIKPTTAAQKALSKYGLNVDDLNPKVHGFTNVLERLAEAGISAADAAVIFEARGVTGFLALADAVPEMRELTDQLNKAEGAAKRMADTRMDTLIGDWQKLKSAMAEVVLASGEDGIEGSMRSLVQTTTEGVRWMGENWNWLRDGLSLFWIDLVDFADQAWAGLTGGLADLASNFKVTWLGLKGIILGIIGAIEQTFLSMIAGITRALQSLVQKAATISSVLPGGLSERLQGAAASLGGAATTFEGPGAIQSASQEAFRQAEEEMRRGEAASAARMAGVGDRGAARHGARQELMAGPVIPDREIQKLSDANEKVAELNSGLEEIETRNAFDVLGESLNSFTNGFDAALNRFGSFQQRLNDMGEGIAFSIDANLTDALTDFVMGTKSAEEAFAQFAQAMIADLIRIMIQQIIVRSLMTALGGIGGAPMAHSGGVAGSALPGHPTASTGDFSGARHFQGGGVAGDEVPVVAHRGEGIFTEEQMEALGQAINGGERQRPVEIINVADPSMVDERIAANPDATLNVINRNRQSVRRMLGMGG